MNRSHKCLSSIHEILGSTTASHKTGGEYLESLLWGGRGKGSEVQGDQLHGELEVSLGYTRHCLGHRSQSLGIQRESWCVFSINRQKWSIKPCLNDQGDHIAFKLQDRLWINIFSKEYNKIQILYIFSNFSIFSWITLTNKMKHRFGLHLWKLNHKKLLQMKRFEVEEDMALMSEQRKSLNKSRNFKGKDADTVLDVYKRYNNCEFFKNYTVSLRANWRWQRVGELADRLIISLIYPFILFALALCLENFLTPVKKDLVLKHSPEMRVKKKGNGACL